MRARFDATRFLVQQIGLLHDGPCAKEAFCSLTRQSLALLGQFLCPVELATELSCLR